MLAQRHWANLNYSVPQVSNEKHSEHVTNTIAPTLTGLRLHTGHER